MQPPNNPYACGGQEYVPRPRLFLGTRTAEPQRDEQLTPATNKRFTFKYGETDEPVPVKNTRVSRAPYQAQPSPQSDSCSSGGSDASQDPMLQEWETLRRRIDEARAVVRAARENERRVFEDYDLFHLEYHGKVERLTRDYDRSVQDRRAGWTSMSRAMAQRVNERRRQQAEQKVRREYKTRERLALAKKFEACKLKRQADDILKSLHRKTGSQKYAAHKLSSRNRAA